MALKSVKPVISIIDKIREYASLRTQSGIIKKRMETLSTDIKDYAGTHGSKDDKGSFSCSIDGFIIGKIAKKSISFDAEKTIKFLKDHNMRNAIKVVEVIDEVKVEELIQSGDISYADLADLTNEKVNYSVDVKEQAAMPEVEETTIQMAASRKPTTKIKRGK